MRNPLGPSEGVVCLEKGYERNGRTPVKELWLNLCMHKLTGSGS